MSVWRSIKNLWYSRPEHMQSGSILQESEHRGLYRKYRTYQASRPTHSVLNTSKVPPKWSVVRKEVYRIVDEVNSKFVYTRDTFGDDWTVPVPRNNTILADCDGYAAFIKEELLASKMFSEYCLRLALCKANPQTTTKIDHMVLLLLLEEGDRVIDNNNLYFIQDWRSYSYTWAYRETGTGALEEIIGS